MTLPVITLPKVELPFDIPVLLHPPVDHFMIALPVVILLLELINLVLRKRAIGGVSFLLIFLTVIVAVGAYLTGLVDGKEAYPALGEAAKEALSEHKLLGTYLLLASVVVFFFKFISAVTGNGILKSLYMLVLIGFVVGIFEQGKEGGELVYVHGLNVEKVKTLDDELFDLKDELEELTPKVEKSESVSTPADVETPKVEEVAPKIEQTEPVTTSVVTETPKVEAAPQVPAVILPEETTPVETVRTEMNEEIVPSVQEPVKVLEVEGMPEEAIQPEIATH
jgi:uncharacterized membrane protein